jgi:mono/diheme cytochrome c family protein
MLTLARTGLKLAAAAIVLGACTETGSQRDVMPTRADGAAFFAANCASCHGSDGRGSGVFSADVAQRPRDLTTLAAQNGGTFPTARVLSYIYGDPENSHLARVMPQFGPDMAEDLVPVEIDGVLTPTPRELAGLLVYLESIQR